MTADHLRSLKQAREQIEILAAAEKEYLDANPFRLVHQNDARSGRYLVRVQILQPVPDDLAARASDVVRALRQALDDLATSLAGKPVRFPIFESLALFAQRARKAIASMPDEAQATLEELQPYHAIGGFENAPLWRLQRLALADPPPFLVGGVVDGTMGVNTQRDVAFTGDPVIMIGPFAEGAIVASAPTRLDGTDPKLDMFVRVRFALAYASGGPGRGESAVTLLRDLCDEIEHGVFAALDPASPS